jgi:UDP-N-acetylglucosamine--N-acetylmuramyl-(pentapeptide) pyrophosphoryl-undecaprenol N-acetylglucosamine transferase
MRVIISGGGTGGHVFPAIAIADALKRLKPEVEILFVGAKGKMEMEKVPKAGYPIKGLWISGFQRKLSLKNLTFPIKLVHSLWNARLIIKKFKPDVLVGVGGYASWPILEMGFRSGIPGLIQEQNSYPGIANKMLANKVKKICVAYDQMERFFPKEKIVLTGNPVRKDMICIADKKDEAMSHFERGQTKKTICLFGGSLGARSLNEAVASNFELIQSHPEVNLIWQVGKLYYDHFSKLPVASLPNVQIKAFVDRMDLAYALADLVICRAGASTISELCVAAKPAIFVPSPNVAEDHQTKNAQALVEKNAGWMVKDSEAKESLFKKAFELLAMDGKRAEIAKRISELGRPEADERIAEEVLQLVKS